MIRIHEHEASDIEMIFDGRSGELRLLQIDKLNNPPWYNHTIAFRLSEKDGETLISEIEKYVSEGK